MGKIGEYQDRRDDYARKKNYHICVSDKKSVKTFYEKIGFVHEKKQNRIEGSL
ncbi:unnamed protein product, partial [marine sediment metagenome]